MGEHGKGILRDQHHLNAFEDHTVYPSALPGGRTNGFENLIAHYSGQSQTKSVAEQGM